MPYSLDEFRSAYQTELRNKFGKSHNETTIMKRYKQYLKMANLLGADADIVMEKNERGTISVRLRPKYPETICS